jgi:gluconolactonase
MHDTTSLLRTAGAVLAFALGALAGLSTVGESARAAAAVRPTAPAPAVATVAGAIGNLAVPDADGALASVALTTAEGLAQVGGTWRYADATLERVGFRAPDAQGQPTGAPVETFAIVPRAGRAEFDDSQWPSIPPESLVRRRGNGRVSFNWYRLTFTVPETLGTRAVRDGAIVFATRLDDYAEVWVDGELARPYGGSGGHVVAGWNAPNRVLVTRRARPGDRHVIAVFGMNGPISDAPTNFIYVREAGLELHAAQPAPVAVPPQEVNVEVDRVDPEIDGIVPANAKLWKVADGFTFTEGPVWSRTGGYLLFSDPNENRIYRYDETHGLSVFRDRSGYDAADIGEYRQPGSNGLTFDREGRLIADEHGRHRVTRTERDGRITVLADAYQGRRLNSPNDLVAKSDGAVYFTDPPFGLPRAYDDPRKQLPYSGVFRWRDGRLDLLTTELRGPNGIAFTPDEKYLYVADWDPAHKVVNRYPVRADGRLGRAETFVDLTDRIPGDEALDGLKVDVRGHVYLSAPGGVWIFAADGRHLGTVRAPHPVHNFAWGGADGRTLYLCARSALYRIDLQVEGVRP